MKTVCKISFVGEIAGPTATDRKIAEVESKIVKKSSTVINYYLVILSELRRNGLSANTPKYPSMCRNHDAGGDVWLVVGAEF